MFKKYVNSIQNEYSGVFGVADHQSHDSFSKFKMAEIFFYFLDSLETCHSGIFGVPDDEYNDSFCKLKMTNPIWRIF